MVSWKRGPYERERDGRRVLVGHEEHWQLVVVAEEWLAILC